MGSRHKKKSKVYKMSDAEIARQAQIQAEAQAKAQIEAERKERERLIAEENAKIAAANASPVTGEASGGGTPEGLYDTGALTRRRRAAGAGSSTYRQGALTFGTGDTLGA